MEEISLESTGNLLFDSVSTLGFFEILCRADPLLKARVTIGSQNLMMIKCRWKPDEVQNIFQNILDDETMKERLNTRINLGGPKPLAYEYLNKLLKELRTEELSNFPHLINVVDLSKNENRREEQVLLPMSLMPIYGKGLRRWDSSTKGISARTSSLRVISYLVGLAYYSITYRFMKGRQQEERFIIIVPAINTRVNEQYLMAIRRISDAFSTSEGKSLVKQFGNVPVVSLPLLLFSLIDFGTLSFLVDNAPQFIFFSIERGRAAREYELMSTSNSIRFFYELGESSYAFKRFLRDLASVNSKKELGSQATEVLLDISLAINFGNPNKLLKALYTAMNIRYELSKKKKHMIYVPDQEELARTIKVLNQSKTISPQTYEVFI